MGYQALYRLWRPQTFRDVVDQQHITKTLQNALLEENYSHAYLFCGPRGTGKTSTAKILAKAVNCEQAPVAEPCNTCAACKGISNGSIVDVIEIDAASNNGVDEIRDIRDQVRFLPTEVRKKVYIIDEVHMLSTGAFNALLKTLEEPPEHVLFILATTEVHKIPLTIISRCQRFDFRRISKQTIAAHLKNVSEQENIQIEERALQLVAQTAEGGMRDALSLLDQVAAYTENDVTLDDVLSVTGAVAQETLDQLVDAMLQGEVKEALRAIQMLIDQGKEPARLVEDLIYYCRDLLLYQASPQLETLFERAQVTEAFQKKAEQYTKQQITSAIEKLSQAQSEMKFTQHPRILLEIACLQLSEASEAKRTPATTHQEPLAQADPSTAASADIHVLKQKIEQLEQTVQSLQRGWGSVGARRENSNDQAEPSIKYSADKLVEMLKSANKSLLVQLMEQWNQILQEVKKKKIMLKALLDDCEPVACAPDYFILAFRNEFHRNTTEKRENREIIEAIVSQKRNTPVKMISIMYNEWDEIKERFIRQQRGNEKGQDKETSSVEQERHVQEAIKLVGEDLVEVVTDQDQDL